MDWRLNYMVQTTTSSLLFLTGQMHRLCESRLLSLNKLIDASYSDINCKTIFFLRRRHPAAVALACLAITLIFFETHENDVDLLRDVGTHLGMLEFIQDQGFMLCPADPEHKEPYLHAMRYLGLVVHSFFEDDE